MNFTKMLTCAKRNGKGGKARTRHSHSRIE